MVRFNFTKRKEIRLDLCILNEPVKPVKPVNPVKPGKNQSVRSASTSPPESMSSSPCPARLIADCFCSANLALSFLPWVL